jgi:hypothetical protein
MRYLDLAGPAQGAREASWIVLKRRYRTVGLRAWERIPGHSVHWQARDGLDL